MKTSADYPEGSDERGEFEDAFNEGQGDADDGEGIRNQYERGTPGWHGYNAGVKAAEKEVGPNNEAQSTYDANWPAPFDAMQDR